MPIIVFSIVSLTGLYVTKIILKAWLNHNNFAQQKHAYILAFGLGLTWLFSFLLPVAIARNFKLEIELFLFIISTAVIVWIMTYLIDRFLIKYKR